MGGVEKRSLPKYATSSGPGGCSGLKLHCFPDITGSPADARRHQGSDKERFKRVIPGSGPCGCDFPNGESDGGHGGKEISAEEAEQIAYQRGFCEGEKTGLARGEKIGFRKGRQAVDPLFEALTTLLASLENIRLQTYETVETEIVALSLAIARKIVGQELAIRPDLVLNAVRNALGQLEGAGQIRIKLNPEDLKLLEEVKADLTAGIQTTGRVTLTGDDAVACGGCMIETDAGEIDARLETQFQVIEENFEQEISRPPTGE